MRDPGVNSKTSTNYNANFCQTSDPTIKTPLTRKSSFHLLYSFQQYENQLLKMKPWDVNQFQAQQNTIRIYL